MKRFLFTVLFGTFAWCGIYCQNTKPNLYGYDNKYYKDSITESYYPRFYRLSPGSFPFTPLPSRDLNYRSELGEVIIAPGDTIRCVVSVYYFSKKDHHTKSYGNAELKVKRFKDGKIQPYGCWFAEKDLKQLKKRLKFKIELCIPDCLGGKPLIVTAKVNYDAINPRYTEVEYSVKDYLGKKDLYPDMTYGEIEGRIG